MLISGLLFPDSCPESCTLREDLSRYGQNSICIRCPVFNCGEDREGGGVSLPLLSPQEYRGDWAQEWAKFFKEGKVPLLSF